MNKKAQFGFENFVFGMVGIFVLVLIIASLVAVQDGGLDVKNVSITLDNTQNNVTNTLKIQESNGVIVNVMYSFVNFIIYSSFEVTKAAITYTVANPSFINPHTLLWLIIISLCIPIVWYGFLMIVSIFLIIKEWYLNRKEKKQLNEIRETK
jgi:hypothetical protein